MEHKNLNSHAERKNLLHQPIALLRKYFDILWGNDLPDVETMFPDEYFSTSEKYDLYKKEERKLILRRFLVIVFLVFISFVIQEIVKSINFDLRNNQTVLCWDKPVCIYRGAKLKYPIASVFQTKKIEDGKILFSSPNAYGRYRIFAARDYEDYANLTADKRKSAIAEKKPSFQIYDIEKNKFEKFDIPLWQFSKEELKKLSRGFYFDDKNRKVIFLDNSYFLEGYENDEDFYVYNLEDKSLTLDFATIPENTKYYCGYQYGNKVLCFTNYSNSVIYDEYLNGDYSDDFFAEIIEDSDNKIITRPEYLYTFDLTTLKMKPLASFDVNPKFFPQNDSIIFLKNGKIIIPIYQEKIKERNIWDHIEIYDPKTRKMYAEFNTDIFEKNFLQVEDEKGNLIFLNEDDSYILENDSVRFRKIQNPEVVEYNEYMVKKLRKLAKTTFNSGDKLNFAAYVKSLPLSEGKFLLIYSNKQRFIRNFRTSNMFVEFPNPKLYRTIYVDYYNGIVQEGPQLPINLGKPTKKTITQIDKNKYLLVGGQRKMCEIDYSLYCPTEYSYIIEVK